MNARERYFPTAYGSGSAARDGIRVDVEIKGFNNRFLDLRRPEAQRALGTSGPGVRRQTLTATVREFLGRRPLDAELNRETFVTLGVEYLETAARSDDGTSGSA